jgi:maltose alpha-D-glucosyltransferase/alpha-amylase
MDPEYGYEAINVEAQERAPFSLLHWMKRMIALRKQHPVFGRGSLQFVPTDNRKVLTYVRRLGNDIVLCVANLARTVQPVEIPLHDFTGLTPVEMLGRAEFPRIGEQPYFLTLAPYGFYWFQLQEVVTAITARTAPAPEEPIAIPALFAGVVWDSVLDGSMREIIEKQALVPFLERQRWFGGKARGLARARFADWTTLRGGSHPAFLTIVEAEYADGGRERYVLALAMSSEHEALAIEEHHPAALLARISGARKGALYDGLYDDGTCAALLAAMRDERTLQMRDGVVQGDNLHLTPQRAPADTLVPIARTAPDQSNSSVIFGKRLVMKMFRRLEEGPNPDLEIGEYLTGRRFPRVPALVGSISYTAEGRAKREGWPDAPGLPASIAMLQEYVFNQGNAWQVTMEELGRFFERVAGLPLPADAPAETAEAWAFGRVADAPPSVAELIRAYLAGSEILGRRTGEMHHALASESVNPAFAPEPMTRDDLERSVEGMRRRADEHLSLLEAVLPRLDARTGNEARQLLDHRDALLQQFEELRGVGPSSRIRCHGDYHLGQVLVTEGDVMILDFEGEPARPLAERRTKGSPLRDVAGMVRSISYAALTALGAATETRPEDAKRLAPWAAFWEAWVNAAFLRAYLGATRGAPFMPAPRDLEVVLRAWVLDKALYELAYELNNRPAWVHIPLAGLRQLHSRTTA